MGMNRWVEAFEESFKKKEVPDFHIGDTVRVLTQIIEGEKERIQAFQGIVIARKGQGVTETFTVHRVSYGVGVNRIFYIHSPRLTDIQVVRRGDVRKSKLYYLTSKKGKDARVQEKITAKESVVATPSVKEETIIGSNTQP